MGREDLLVASDRMGRGDRAVGESSRRSNAEQTKDLIMPLTKKGMKIMRAMKSQYGAKRGARVFYASQNKGVIRGTHRAGKRGK